MQKKNVGTTVFFNTAETINPVQLLTYLKEFSKLNGVAMSGPFFLFIISTVLYPYLLPC